MRSHLLIDSASCGPMEIGNAQVEIWACSQSSPEHPDRNEDAAGCWHLDDGSIILAVADGMGGAPLGAESSAIAVGGLGRILDERGETNDLRPLVLDAFEHANRAILDDSTGSGSTFVVCELVDNRVRIYNVGDSGAMLVGQRGRVKIETIAHSPVGYGVAAGLIDPERALAHDDRHYVSNHLGSHSMHIEIGSSHSMAPCDTLLIASDGLLDNIAPGELVDSIRCGSLGRASEQLKQLCTQRMDRVQANKPGKPDDLTFLLARRRRS